MRQLIIAIALLVCAVARAEDRIEICAEYTDSGKKYHVNAIDATGLDLNYATNSIRYNSVDHYIVIFWKQNEATVINVGAVPTYTFTWQGGTDQEGRRWRISALTMFCP